MDKEIATSHQHNTNLPNSHNGGSSRNVKCRNLPTGKSNKTTKRSNGSARTFNLTDAGNAERLVERYRTDIRYCAAYGKWFIWDDTRWVEDATGRIEHLAKCTIRSMYAEAADMKDDGSRSRLCQHALCSESYSRLTAMLKWAKSDPTIQIVPHQFDSDGWLLNVLNGTIDLRTGILRRPRREDYITNIIPISYNPDAKCPEFHKFIEQIIPDIQTREFLQRATGYTLTGDTSEQVFFYCYGGGSNGKSTLLKIIEMLVQGYSWKASAESFMQPSMIKDGGAASPERAALMGKRLVTVAEIANGQRLNEAWIKDVTGDDLISARRLHADPFNFRPTFKVWMYGNHKPIIKGTDEGIWRRVRLIEFNVQIPPHQRDKSLGDKLKSELPGILAWAIAGCLKWQQSGLGETAAISNAIQKYREEMDVTGRFIAECCETGAQYKSTADELWIAYQQWCAAVGEDVPSRKLFGQGLTEREFQRRKVRNRWEWRGLRVAPYAPCDP